jgi:hypothetical protein
MTDQADLITRIVDRALDVVFAKYPARTGLGVILGGTLTFLAQIFEPGLRSISFVDFSHAPLWGWLALGILILHAPTIRALFKQRPIGDDTIDQALDLIERGNFSLTEKRQQYRNLITQVSTKIALNATTQREVSTVERSIDK